jgi:hypothetical protein
MDTGDQAQGRLCHAWTNAGEPEKNNALPPTSGALTEGCTVNPLFPGCQAWTLQQITQDSYTYSAVTHPPCRAAPFDKGEQGGFYQRRHAPVY